MKNRQAIAIIEDISKQHTSSAEQRAFDKAIAALQYCGNLTYYTETKKFGIETTDRLVQKVNWNLPNLPSQQLYMYGEASVEANQEMQEPLERLYQYEKQQEQFRDTLENLTEYIESHSDNVTNYVNAKDVLEYVDDMWKVFGIDSKKNRECENEVI